MLLQSIHSYCLLLLHIVFLLELSTSNPFMTAGSPTNPFASHSLCTSLPMISSLKRMLPRSLFWIAGDSSPHSSVFYWSYRSYFFPSLPFFRQIMLPGVMLLGQQAKAVFYLRFLYYCFPKPKTKSNALIFLLNQIETYIHIYTYTDPPSSMEKVASPASEYINMTHCK